MTVTPSEYIKGNPSRGIEPHPIASLPGLQYLWPGSWIGADFSTWIGESEENRAWEYLLQMRAALEESGIPQPDPLAPPPPPESREWYGWMAWEEMYAAVLD